MSRRICIRCLPPAFDENSLLRICSSFGEVTDFDRRTTTTAKKEESVVEVGFEEADDAIAAAGNMNGMEFSGEFLRVFVKR